MGLDTKDDRANDPVPGVIAVDRIDDLLAPWRELPPTRTTESFPVAPVPVPEMGSRLASAESLLRVDPSNSLDVLDDPRLVISEGYVGRDRRRTGVRARLVRTTHGFRRRLLRLEVLVIAAVAVMVLGASLMVSASNHPLRANTADAAPSATPNVTARPHPHTLPTVVAPTADAPAGVTATAPPAPPATPAPRPAVTTAATPAPPATIAAPAPPATVPETPDAMGAAALALIRYPWQQLAGYSIVFLPISDAPSPGYYGNTDFTWGRAGGTSTLYVYPGETVQHLAGITAFEIGHEVDAAYVEPDGGHQAIADLLGIHPASWAPECDCAEQGYLSGWYAAAFSNYWSPGVGNWSTLAPEPTGATLTAMEPWLDPRIP